MNVSQFRLAFTLDALANMFGFVGTSTLTSLTITNFEVGYELFQPPTNLRNQIMSRPSIQLKTMTYQHSSQPIAVGSSGTQSLTFNVRYNSIKAIFLTFTPTAVATSITAGFLNNAYDCIDITNGSSSGSTGGDYCIIINGTQYPNKTLSTLTARAQIFTELKKACTTLGVEYTKIYDKNNDVSITQTEWLYPATTTTLTTKAAPSKFIVGIHTEKLHNNSIFFSGVSSQNSAITVRVNIPVATTVGVNCNLTCVCDSVLDFDLTQGMINVRQ
jgi:hypothetical protein